MSAPTKYSPTQVGKKMLRSGAMKQLGLDAQIEPLKLSRTAPAVLRSLFLLSRRSAALGRQERSNLIDTLVKILQENQKNTLLRPETFGFKSHTGLAEFLVDYFENSHFRQSSTRDFLRIKRRLGNYRRLKGIMFQRMLVYSPAFQKLTNGIAAEFVAKVLRDDASLDFLETAGGKSLKMLLPSGVTSLNDKGVKIQPPVMYHSVRINFREPVEYNGIKYSSVEATDIAHLTEIVLPSNKKLQALSLETEIKTEGAVGGLPYQLSSGEARLSHDNVKSIEFTHLDGQTTTTVTPDELLIYRSEEIGKSPYKFGVSPPTHDQWNNMSAGAKQAFEASLRSDASLNSSIQHIDYALIPTAGQRRGFAVFVKGTIMVSPGHLESLLKPLFFGD